MGTPGRIAATRSSSDPLVIETIACPAPDFAPPGLDGFGVDPAVGLPDLVARTFEVRSISQEFRMAQRTPSYFVRHSNVIVEVVLIFRALKLKSCSVVFEFHAEVSGAPGRGVRPRRVRAAERAGPGGDPLRGPGLPVPLRVAFIAPALRSESK